MTLIIGVRCGDGVVIGSDSVSTYASPDGQRTIEQDTGTKIRILQNSVLYASAGAVGLGQDVLRSLDSNWKTITRRPRYHTVKGGIADRIAGEINAYARRMEETLVVANREQQYVTKLGIGFIVALPISDQFHLLTFDAHGNPEEYTSRMPIVTIGSGQAQADPFLAFVKRVAWNDQRPETVKQGIVGVLWTLRYVMARNSALGVGGQMSIGVLETANNDWRASVLVGDRLSLYVDAINDTEQAIFERLNRHETSSISLPGSG